MAMFSYIASTHTFQLKTACADLEEVIVWANVSATAMNGPLKCSCYVKVLQER